MRTIGIPTGDQDRAVAFYVERLGMQVVVDVELPQMGGRWIEVRPAGAMTTIALEPARGDGPAGRPTGIRLVTPDAVGLQGQLRDVGVAVDELLRWPGVPTMFAFRDPDGNELLVVEESRAVEEDA